jgi:predicted patatin/cPLA2 family phospholipase
LAKQVHELKTKKEDSEYIIKGKSREMMEKSQEKDGQIKVLKNQIEKLNNETKSNIEEFIDIAKQIQEINNRKKIDPNTRKKMKTGEIERDEIFELYIQGREQKSKRKQELEQHLQKYTIQEQQQQERC